MTTKPKRAPKPLPGPQDFSVRINGTLTVLKDGRTAALLSEEEGWAAFIAERRVAAGRKVELLRGATVIAWIEPVSEPPMSN
jgi:hypothetical protein